ncbi:MAG: RNA polymerase sigma-70 factor (ECF subfamily) [Pirellulaceae bacterium]|jgi:RNA polymerase sigma-70 factor (ECF subfamily)
MQESDDATIVKAVLSGNSESFGLLYDRYAGIVRAVCYEVTENVVDAQDLAQEVMVAGFKKLSTLDDPQRFGAWIIGVARLQGRQWRRTKSRDRHQFDDQLSSRPHQDSSTSRSEDELTCVIEAMHLLSENERTAIHLFYLDATDAQIAKSVLGVSLSGFYRILDRAKQKLRAHLVDNHED